MANNGAGGCKGIRKIRCSGFGSNYNRNHLAQNTVEIMHPSAILSNGCHYQSKERKWWWECTPPCMGPLFCFAFSLTTAYQPTNSAANFLMVLLHTSCTFTTKNEVLWAVRKTAPVYRSNRGLRRRRVKRGRRRKQKEKMKRQPVEANTRGNLLNKNFLV